MPLSRICWRDAGLEGLLWVGELEKKTFVEPISYGDLGLLQDVRGARIREWYYADRRPSAASRIGYTITIHRPTRIEIERIVTIFACQRRGYGREMLRALAADAAARSARRIVAEMSDRSIEAQQFFAACGYRCIAQIGGRDEGRGTRDKSGTRGEGRGARDEETLLQFELRLDGRPPTEFSAIDRREWSEERRAKS